MKRCVIIGGAKINNYEAVRVYLKPESDFYIYCDSGLNHAEALGAKPDLIVGDFDSHEVPGDTDAEIIKLSHFKDDTDTEHAVRVAQERGFTDFLLIGTVGGRLDHSLGNVALLYSLESAGAKALMVDDYSEMEVAGHGAVEISDRFSYFSTLSLDGPASGVNITDALYPLCDAAIDCEHSLGVSNEPLRGKTARVSVAYGRLLVIKVR